VIHGQALKAFHAASAKPDITRRVGQFSKTGLELAACGNTMKSQNVTVKDLLPGFIAADKGGVVRIAELQSQGYLYLRP
jgi:intracellular sulfur oxidation DsrE/DsrF family protein